MHDGAVNRKADQMREEREAAWLGDAVLALYARQFVLRERNSMDGEWFTRMTSNDFLSAFGNPTRVEASIGNLYLEGVLNPPSAGRTKILFRISASKTRSSAERSD